MIIPMEIYRQFQLDIIHQHRISLIQRIFKMNCINYVPSDVHFENAAVFKKVMFENFFLLSVTEENL